MQTLQIQEWRPWQARNARSKTFLAKKSRTKKVTSGQVGENKGDHPTGRYNTNCMQTKTDQEQRTSAYRQFKADAWECQIESLGPLHPRKARGPKASDKSQRHPSATNVVGDAVLLSGPSSIIWEESVGGQLRGTSCSFSSPPCYRPLRFLGRMLLPMSYSFSWYLVSCQNRCVALVCVSLKYCFPCFHPVL
jgi:hypothetical protein